MKLHAGSQRLVRAIIFATILLDFVGFSILIPVLPLYARDLGASETQIGLLLALYSLGLVVFLPLWGWVSDRFGRRPVLLVCLLGTAGSFAFLALAENLWQLYLARILGGLFGASIGTAQAYMTDITDHAERAEGMGLIGAAFGIGFVLGNLLGGTLQAIQPGLPFYATAALALSNFVLAVLYLPETRRSAPSEVPWARLMRALVPTPVLLLVTVHANRTRVYLYLFFHIFLSFAALEAMFALFASARFGWTEWDVGFYMAYVGILIGATQGLLIGRLSERFGEVPLVLTGLVLTGTGMLLLPATRGLLELMAVGAAVAFGNGIAFPAFTSLYTKVCRTDETGETLGQSQAMAQTGRTLGALASGWALDRLSQGAPFALGGLGMLAAAAIFLVARRMLVPGTEFVGYGAAPGVQEDL